MKSPETYKSCQGDVAIGSSLFKLAGILLVGLFVLSSTSCRPESSSGPLVIEFWTPDSEQERIEIQERLALEFAKRYPDCRVKVVGVPENLLSERLSSYKAAGRMPAVIRIGLEYLGGYTRGSATGHGAVLDTGAATEVIRALGEESFLPRPLALMRAGRQGYAAVPIDGWVQGLWYRRDWFEQLGLPRPESWQAILAAARTLHDPARGRYGIVIGTDPQQVYTQQTFEHIALSAGVRVFDPSGKLAIPRERLKRVLEFYRELAGFCPPGHNGWREARRYYLSGRAAMIFYSSYILDDIAHMEATDQGMAGLGRHTDFVARIKGPYGESGSYGQVAGLGITAGQDPRQAEAAKRWVAFLASESYLELCNIAPGGKIPMRRPLVEPWRAHPYFSRYTAGLPGRLLVAMDRIQRWGQRDGRVFPLTATLYAHKIFPAAVGRVLQGRLEPAGAAAWIEARVRHLAGDGS